MPNNQSEWYNHERIAYLDLLNQLRYMQKFPHGWAFRGQLERGELETSLERHCRKSGIPLEKARLVEEILIRDFIRIYDEHDSKQVQDDSLYCLSLLRHHDAPTRLLDFSYSSQVALYFGLREAYSAAKSRRAKTSFSLWCINIDAMNERAKKLYSSDERFKDYFKQRASLDRRDDPSFKYLYRNSFDMVVSENPVKIHKRLHLQQGVHLCPGNVNKRFMTNLFSLYSRTGKTNEIIKYICFLTLDELQSAFQDLRKANITEESLFPGLDGQARAYKYNLQYYLGLYELILKKGGS